MPPIQPAETDLAALERFVVDNDDLLQLEEMIGRFNIFDALGIARAEIRHSNFLAWLLDPAESHGQGDLFLKAVLMDLLRQAPLEKRPLSPVEIDGIELRGVEIRREWRNIDLLITSSDPPFVMAFENKVDSGEHSDQLHRYETTLRQTWPDLPKMFVYLTPDGDEASNEAWVSYSYADLHRVLARSRRMQQAGGASDVMVFLDHYLSLIGSQFMDDPRLDELCRRIYRNHRRAIDLIIERIGSPEASAIEAVVSLLSDRAPNVIITARRRSWVNFMPASWSGMLPPIAADRIGARDRWMVVGVGYKDGTLEANTWLGPVTEPPVRERVLEELTRDPDRFGFRPGRRNARWLRLRRDEWYKQSGEDEVDVEAVRAAAERGLARMLDRYADIPNLLRPAIASMAARPHD